MDNLDPSLTGNPDPTTTTTETPAAIAPAQAQTQTFSWKSVLDQDYANSPTMKKFEDTKEGFNAAVKSHLLLEKLLGHEKVPIPKGKDDVVAWELFNKAMGIPEKPEGYGLPEAEIPDSMKGLAFDKKKFAEIVHANKLTPEAAKNLWQTYTEMTKQSYAQALKSQQEKLTGMINQLRGEWGDAYKTKVELGQMVINKFSSDQETNDYITAVLASDPRGVKFLAHIGDQFAENKIGEFKYQRHSLTPDEAQREIDSIRMDMNHPYNNEKAPQAERDRAIDYVNGLIGVARKPRG